MVSNSVGISVNCSGEGHDHTWLEEALYFSWIRRVPDHFAAEAAPSGRPG